MMLIKCDCKQAITNVDQISTLEKWAQTLTLSQVRNFLDSLQKSLGQIALNANLRLVLEILMLEMPKKEETRGHAMPAPVSL
jgi:DNA polymerase III gamma/tau subunit